MPYDQGMQVRTSRELLDAAIEVTRRAGEVARKHHAKLAELSVELKSDGSPVTVADRAAEDAARAFLEEHFPEDGILGEEGGAVRADAKRKWCLDPIDGTKSFVSGVPLWGSLAAVIEDGVVLAGAMCFPMTGEGIAAAPGLGCVVQGPARAGVSPVASIDQALVLCTDYQFKEAPERASPFSKLATRARQTRTWGDCYGYYLVATGRAEFMSDGMLSPWDCAVLFPILEEAGGIVTSWRGERDLGGTHGAIATNRVLAKEIRDVLGVPFPK